MFSRQDVQFSMGVYSATRIYGEAPTKLSSLFDILSATSRIPVIKASGIPRQKYYLGSSQDFTLEDLAFPSVSSQYVRRLGRPMRMREYSRSYKPATNVAFRGSIEFEVCSVINGLRYQVRLYPTSKREPGCCTFQVVGVRYEDFGDARDALNAVVELLTACGVQTMENRSRPLLMNYNLRNPIAPERRILIRSLYDRIGATAPKDLGQFTIRRRQVIIGNPERENMLLFRIEGAGTITLHSTGSIKFLYKGSPEHFAAFFSAFSAWMIDFADAFATVGLKPQDGVSG